MCCSQEGGRTPHSPLVFISLHWEPAHPESLISPEVHVKPFKLISQKDLISPVWDWLLNGKEANCACWIGGGQGEVSWNSHKTNFNLFKLTKSKWIVNSGQMDFCLPPCRSEHFKLTPGPPLTRSPLDVPRLWTWRQIPTIHTLAAPLLPRPPPTPFPASSDYPAEIAKGEGPLVCHLIGE